jgi:hypothetical protein
MKRKLKSAVIGSVSIFALALVLITITPSVHVYAGGDDNSDSIKQINPPPFDFADFFYE